MAVFEIHRLNRDDFRLLINFNNKIEFMSIAFKSRIECLKMVRFIRKASQLDKTYAIKNLKCGSWYFEFKSLDQKTVLGTSNSYADKSIVLEKIVQMKMHTPNAKFKRNNYMSIRNRFDNLLLE